MQYSLNDLLMKIGKIYDGWECLDEPVVRVPWDTFYKHMVLDQSYPILTYKRTIREKWKLLQELGFAKAINGNLIAIDVDKVRKQLRGTD